MEGVVFESELGRIKLTARWMHKSDSCSHVLMFSCSHTLVFRISSSSTININYLPLLCRYHMMHTYEWRRAVGPSGRPRDFSVGSWYLYKPTIITEYYY